MALGLGWTLKGDGRALGPDEVVAPDERLSWGKTAGLGAQHVVAMFGATFVFPLVMGLNPQLAIMMSGVATIAFLLIVEGKVPSYLGTSAAFVGGVTAIRVNGGTSSEVTGAILVAGLVRIEHALKRRLGVNDDVLAAGHVDDQIGSQHPVVAAQLGLLGEVAVREHAGELDHVAKLHLTPLAARVGLSQGGHQRARLGAQLVVGVGGRA